VGWGGGGGGGGGGVGGVGGGGGRRVRWRAVRQRAAGRKGRYVMDVYEAVRTRRSVRGFIDRPVPVEALERVVSAATWAPSGSNIQPWQIYVGTGARLAELKRLPRARVAAGGPWDEREGEMYPPQLKSPYRE